MVLGTIATLSRILVLPLVIYLLQKEVFFTSSLALIILILAGLVDLVENHFALKQEKINRVRSFLNPFADKIVALGLLFYFVWQGIFSFPFFLLFISIDFLMGIVRWMATRDDILFKERKFSRLVIYFQFSIVIGLIIQEITFSYWWFVLMDKAVVVFTLLAIVFAIVSIIHYASIYYQRICSHRHLGHEIKPQRMLILANRRAGGSKDRYRNHLLKVFARRREAQIIYLPPLQNMYAGIEKKLNSFDHIIIAGGDGSFDSALNYAPLKKKSLGFFPFGKGNAFYSYFYRGKRFEYLRSRFQFREAYLDIVQLEYDKKKIETEFLSIGIDSEIIRLSQDRKSNGFWAYFKAGAKGVVQAKASFDLDLKIDDKEVHWNNCFNGRVRQVFNHIDIFSR